MCVCVGGGGGGGGGSFPIDGKGTRGARKHLEKYGTYFVYEASWFSPCMHAVVNIVL